MNGVLMPLLLTLDKYLFCTKTSKFGNHKISYVQHNAGYDKILQANSILNRNISKKQLNVCPKNLLVSVTALACPQQEQSTLQNTKQIPKNFLLSRISGVPDESNFIQIVKGSSPLMLLKLTKHSSQT